LHRSKNGALLSDKIRADFPLHVCRSILLLAVARDTLFSYHINITSITLKQHNIYKNTRNHKTQKHESHIAKLNINTYHTGKKR